MNEQTAVFNLGIYIASPSANLRLSVTSPYVSRCIGWRRINPPSVRAFVR